LPEYQGFEGWRSPPASRALPGDAGAVTDATSTSVTASSFISSSLSSERLSARARSDEGSADTPPSAIAEAALVRDAEFLVP
jgi:hypothetical protein